MILRDYQRSAVDAAIADLDGGGLSTLLIMATGTGKTLCFSKIADHYSNHGRVLVIAHRKELIYQAAKKIKLVTGEEPEIEMAGEWASHDAGSLINPSRFIVASIQSLIAGSSDRKRVHRFDPNDFSLLVLDEAHHGVSKSFAAVLAHFRTNENLKTVGVTATGDRADGEGLGGVFDSITYTYELPDAIRDGWLVPVQQRSVVIEGLDFSKCKTTAGDLNQGDLADVMEFEKNLYPVAHATIEQSAGLDIGTLNPLKDDEDRCQKLADLMAGRRLRKTLVFTVSVKQAERLAEVFNRWIPECAKFVCGETRQEDRDLMMDDYKAGRFSILVNCAVCSEGFDEPSIEVVVQARPTKSRALFAQQIGRGTRPLDEIAGPLGECGDADTRRALIEQSPKPACVVLDFVGNAGKHKLITCADILSGDFVSEGVIDRANELAQEKSIDVSEALRIAQDEEEEANQLRAEAQAAREQDEEDHLAEIQRRARLVGTAQYQIQTSDPFDKFSRGAPRVQANGPRGGATDKQVEFLVSLGCDRKTAMGYTKGQAGAVITSMKEKHHTAKQGRYLAFLGYSQGDIDGMNFDAASAAIGAAKARQEAAR